MGPLRPHFKVLSYKEFVGRDTLNKYVMFSKSKLILISTLTKTMVVMIFIHNRAALL